ncbi:hypothetical protein IP79_12810 [Porphyrobacter sp. AAP60]|nr:hypothetical protein IP79_12810 [Porphyrobacter sp. AAP60]
MTTSEDYAYLVIDFAMRNPAETLDLTLAKDRCGRKIALLLGNINVSSDKFADSIDSTGYKACGLCRHS